MYAWLLSLLLHTTRKLFLLAWIYPNLLLLGRWMKSCITFWTIFWTRRPIFSLLSCRLAQTCYWVGTDKQKAQLWAVAMLALRDKSDKAEVVVYSSVSFGFHLTVSLFMLSFSPTIWQMVRLSSSRPCTMISPLASMQHRQRVHVCLCPWCNLAGGARHRYAQMTDTHLKSDQPRHTNKHIPRKSAANSLPFALHEVVFNAARPWSPFLAGVMSLSGPWMKKQPATLLHPQLAANGELSVG